MLVVLIGGLESKTTWIPPSPDTQIPPPSEAAAAQECHGFATDEDLAWGSVFSF